METYYLIDFENVREGGLSGCSALDDADHIVIFFTQNAHSLDMSSIANHGKASLDMIEVPAGKQSADMHIGSYLGYLVGATDGKCSVVIVSKDTDFDKVIVFWQKKAGISAVRKQNIAGDTFELAVVPKPIAKTATAKTVSAKERTEINAEMQKLLSKAGFTSDIINFVASTVVKNLNVKNGKQLTYRTIITKYGQNKGLPIYQTIKKSI